MGLEHVGIDQSRRVDKNEYDTGIAYCPLDSMTPNYTILVPRSTTRKVRRRIRPKFKSYHDLRKKWFGPKMYAVTLYYLLKGSIVDIENIHIEKEYEGHQNAILDTIGNWFRDDGQSFNRSKFQCPPGRSDFKAHELSNKIRKRERQANRILEFEDFEKKMLPSRY